MSKYLHLLKQSMVQGTLGTQGVIRRNQVLGKGAAWEVKGHGHMYLKCRTVGGGSLFHR